MRRALMLFAPLLLLACADNRPIVSTPPAACAKLLPENWKTGIKSEPIPDTGTTELDAVKAWASAYVGQTGQLEKANGRLVDAIGIIERCEAMVNASRPDAKRISQ